MMHCIARIGVSDQAKRLVRALNTGPPCTRHDGRARTHQAPTYPYPIERCTTLVQLQFSNTIPVLVVLLSSETSTYPTAVRRWWDASTVAFPPRFTLSSPGARVNPVAFSDHTIPTCANVRAFGHIRRDVI